METIKINVMEKSINKKPEVAFGRTLKNEDEPIQSSRKNIRFKRTINKVDLRLDERLFIVPWQQIG